MRFATQFFSPMTNFKLFISILLSQLAFHLCSGQQTTSTAKIKVNYTMYLNFVGVEEYNATLVANDSIAVFKFSEVKSSERKDGNTAKPDKKAPNQLGTKTVNVIVKLNQLDTNVTIVRRHKNILYSLLRNGAKKKNYYVKEAVPDLDWKLLAKKKQIKGISCHSAKTTFRGRTYFAWYAPSIPISFGPWKLNGLPGLIIEAKDSTNEVIFQAEKVSYTPQKMNASLNSAYDVVGIRKHLKKSREKVKKHSEDFKKTSRKILSQMPKGVTMKIGKTKFEGGMELNFDDLKEK